jgi:hypothetical protein
MIKKVLGISDRARKSRLLLILAMKMVHFGPFFLCYFFNLKKGT